jgi:hypothetical protein
MSNISLSLNSNDARTLIDFLADVAVDFPVDHFTRILIARIRNLAIEHTYKTTSDEDLLAWDDIGEYANDTLGKIELARGEEL